MSKPKFTAGPYHVGQGIGYGSGLFIFDKDGLLIGSADGNIHRSDDEKKANALLFAASSEIHEALEMVRDADDDCKRDGLKTIPPIARAKIDAALAKADGK